MVCKIADLTVEVPTAGDLVPRCKAYRCDEQDSTISVDIKINPDEFREGAWNGLTGDPYIYLESGAHFQTQLLQYDGIVLHSSAVVVDGKAYLFSAPCGTGKSTHTGLWQTLFGEKASIINDDKPALRRIDGRWYVYGTPWCGKDGININSKAELAGICFLKQAKCNRIRRLSLQEALRKILWQTINKFKKEERVDLMLSLLEKLVYEVPVFELENKPELEAAQLSYETMCHAAQEMGL